MNTFILKENTIYERKNTVLQPVRSPVLKTDINVHCSMNVAVQYLQYRAISVSRFPFQKMDKNKILFVNSVISSLYVNLVEPNLIHVLCMICTSFWEFPQSHGAIFRCIVDVNKLWLRNAKKKNRSYF